MNDELKDGFQFVHLVEMTMRDDLTESRATLYALLEELSALGVIDLASLESRRETARVLEKERADKMPRVYLNPVVDKYKLTVLPDLDCKSIIPICEARCCRLVFGLSQQDIDERVVEWEFKRPYLIRRGDDGRCVHQDRATGSCGVYEHRPAPCRTYDCRQDKRIWIDFEKRILAPE